MISEPEPQGIGDDEFRAILHQVLSQMPVNELEQLAKQIAALDPAQEILVVLKKP